MKKITLALGMAALLSGCATMSKGVEHNIMFTSTPTNVLAVFSDDVSCYTPCSRKVKRNQDLDVQFSHGTTIKDVSLKSGFQKDTVKNTAGNLLFFGWVGIVIDLITNKNVGLETNHVHVEF